MTTGIDVSKHNGNIDWEKVKNDNCDFAILRAGYGKFSNQIDSLFKYNANQCILKKIPFGVYWFSYALDEKDAIAEAETCYNTIKDYLDSMTLPVFYDFEYDSESYAEKQDVYFNNASRTAIINAFCKFFKDKNIPCGYYSNADYLKNKLYPKKLNFPLWLAQYNSLPPAFECVLVQRSSSGKVDGIVGNVDMNENISLNVSRETYVSDTTNDENNPVKIEKGKHYTIKITGDDIKLICGVSIPDSPQFAVIKCRREGIYAYWHIVAIGEKGNQAGIYHEGAERICVCEVV